MSNPRPVDGSRLGSMDDIRKAIVQLAHDLYEFSRVTPLVQIRTIESDGTFPISVETDFPPALVLRGQTYEYDDPSRTVNSSGVAWRGSDDPREPGVMIDDLDGITAGTRYKCELIFFGRRQVTQ